MTEQLTHWRGFKVAATNPQLPQRIYKYFPAERQAFNDLRELKVQCQHFDELPNPFELWSVDETTTPLPGTEPERFRRVMRAWGADNGYGNADEEQYLEYVGPICDHTTDNVKRLTRVSSFCAQQDNLPAWTHRADGLRGFCVEFDTNQLVASVPEELDTVWLLRVRYRARPWRFDPWLFGVVNDQCFHFGEYYDKSLMEGPLLLLQTLLKEVVASKPIEWRFEREWRLILVLDKMLNTTSPVSYRYPSTAIISVVTGERMPAESKEELLRVLSDLELRVPLHCASVDPRTRRVRIA
jgi:hypothetical protein